MVRRTINPNMLVLARQSRGHVQSSLAEALNISQGKLSKIELGVQCDVSDDLLRSMSVELRYPESFFFESGTIFPPSSPPQFRKRASLKSRDLEKVQAFSNIQRIHIQKLLRSVETSTTVEYIDVDDYDGNPAKVAQAVRALWKLPKGPIHNLTELVENVGILVIESDFGTNQLDAFTINDGSNPPIVFMNRELLADRARFTLAHELAHIIMHRIPVTEMEKEANIFASEFLLPSAEIKHQLATVDLRVFANLKQYWKVSMAALIVKAQHTGAITDNQYRYLCMQLAKLGYKKREPSHLDFPKETSTLLKEIIDVYLQDLGYSVEDLCTMLQMYSEEFQAVYLGKPLFRVYK